MMEIKLDKTAHQLEVGDVIVYELTNDGTNPPPRFGLVVDDLVRNKFLVIHLHSNSTGAVCSTLDELYRHYDTFQYRISNIIKSDELELIRK